MIISIPKNIWSVTFLLIITGFLPFISSAQSYNYWTRSFNEESSLLSGAVVGGGSGPSSIYYNPASISEVQASKFSLNASLFSFDFINLKNALGEDINIKMSRANIEPRFISYMIKSRRFKNWSFEVAILNNENTKSVITQSVNDQVDVLTGLPGNERYFALYQYENQFRDDWIGFGGSVKLNEKLSLGGSMFVTVKSLSYNQSLDIEAYPLNDSIVVNDVEIPFYVAAYEKSEYLKFNDYRLTWKAGLLYKAENYSVGFSITTPSLGGIYSDGKRVTRSEKQSNITDPDSGEPVPDYIVVDYKEKKDVKVSYKTPFSIAAGFNYYMPAVKQIFYTSAEYFFGIEPFRMVESEESTGIGPEYLAEKMLYSDWLTFVSGARPVFNFAFGSSWSLKKDLLLMYGFRTDFNSRKNLDYGQYADYNKMESFNVDRYNVTCGLSWNILGQDIITGIQYTLGHTKDQQQLVNLSDPVEYNPVDNTTLQGTLTNDMSSWYNSISLYFGASFNFGGDKGK
jgi:hypothetical protein